jgi:hypothetical protein
VWLQQRKRKLNQCVIATSWRAWLQTRSYVWLQENLTLSVWLKKLLVIWNMIASLGSVWLQKLKCVIATSWLGLLKPGVMCGCKKPWLCLCGWKATWLFGIWSQAWVVCDCKKLKCVIAKSAGLFLWLQKRKRKTEPVCDCNYLACVIANQELCVLQKNLTLSVCLQSYLVIWNMIASLDSVWLQKTKVWNCTTCFFMNSI